MRARNILKYPVHFTPDRPSYNITANRKRDGTIGILEDVTGDVRTKTEYKNGKWEITTDEVEFNSNIRYNRDVPREGLVAEYLFHEGTGTILHDTSGFNNHGTIHGMTWDRLQNGKIVGRFDSVDDFVNMLGTENMLMGLKTGTIEVWINTPGRSLNFRGIAGWRDGINSDFYILHLKNSDKLEMRVRTVSGNRDLNPNFANFYGNWIQIYFIRDVTVSKAFFNNVEVASRSDLIDEPWTFPIQFRIAHQKFPFYDGFIGEVRFCNWALSAIERRERFEIRRAIYGV